MDDHLGMIRGALRARGASETPHVIVGHSLGAILAIEYAARFPAEVRGLVLLSLPYYRSAAEARAFIGAHGSWMARLTVANGTGAHAIHIAHMAVQPLLMSFAALFAAVTRVVPPAVAVDSLEHTWASYSRTLDRCILNHNLSPALATLTAVPILALHGTRDLSASLAAVHALATRMPNVVVQPLVCAHHPFIERHDACLDAIVRFTKDLIAIPPVAP